MDQFVPEAKISFLIPVSKNPFGDGLFKHRYRETVDGSEIPKANHRLDVSQTLQIVE